MSKRPQILMCPPEHYGIQYEINPWMSRQRNADHALATKQWEALRGILRDAGVEIVQMEPAEGLPDLVFTANAAMIFHRTAILSQFRHPQRQGEEEHDRKLLAARGFSVAHLPEGMYFEGAGDALFCGENLFAGYRIRSDAIAQQRVGELVRRRVIPLELVDPYYYHLDTCFCPLSQDEAIYFPAAFDDYGRRVLAEYVPKLIPVIEEEARSFACNAVVVGQRVVTNEGCPELHASLAARGYEPIGTPLSEFVKAGGSAKCLTLRLDGEDAAAWREEE